MKVKYKDNKEMVRFDSLDFGEVFKYDGYYFIVAEANEYMKEFDDFDYVGVRLGDGKTMEFAADDMVESANATVFVE